MGAARRGYLFQKTLSYTIMWFIVSCSPDRFNTGERASQHTGENYDVYCISGSHSDISWVATSE